MCIKCESKRWKSKFTKIKGHRRSFFAVNVMKNYLCKIEIEKIYEFHKTEKTRRAQSSQDEIKYNRQNEPIYLHRLNSVSVCI